MTPTEAKHLLRMTVIEQSGHPGTVVGVANHGFFVIWQGDKTASYIKFDEAGNIDPKPIQELS